MCPNYVIDNKPPSGWEEPSPPTQRRNIPNYDDGTSLWAPSVSALLRGFNLKLNNEKI